MPQKTLPLPEYAQTKMSGYYDTTDLQNGLKGPVAGAIAATSAATDAGVAAENVCVFRWDDREAIAGQLGIDPPP